LCAQMHTKFIEDVKRKRGNKIKADESTFSADVWLGEEALQRGLVDEVGSLVEVLAARHPGAKL
jgi:protease-4